MEPELGPLPFVMGVVGHRDLRHQDTAALAAAVGAILDDFRALMPHTPFVVLSALAEGADRLVAKQALVKRLRLIVTLPMPRASHETDFGPDSLKEFDDLALRAHSVFELPLVNGLRDTSVLSAGHARNLQYAQAG